MRALAWVEARHPKIAGGDEDEAHGVGVRHEPNGADEVVAVVVEAVEAEHQTFRAPVLKPMPSSKSSMQALKKLRPTLISPRVRFQLYQINREPILKGP